MQWKQLLQALARYNTKKELVLLLFKSGETGTDGEMPAYITRFDFSRYLTETQSHPDRDNKHAQSRDSATTSQAQHAGQSTGMGNEQAQRIEESSEDYAGDTQKPGEGEEGKQDASEPTKPITLSWPKLQGLGGPRLPPLEKLPAGKLPVLTSIPKSKPLGMS